MRDLAAQKQLQRLGPPDRLRPCRAYGVAAVEPIEHQFLCVRCSGVRLHQLGTVLVEPHGHVEQIVRRILLMRENENLLTPSVGRLVIKPGTDICRAALLSGLEDQHSDPTSVLVGVHFDPRMQVLLHTVEQQRLDLARLRTDLQAASGVMCEVVSETLPDRPLSLG
jgi:hypothetical protein